MGSKGHDHETFRTFAPSQYKGLANALIERGILVTRERIRQIEAKALRKLRHPSRSRTLCAFL